MRGSPVTLRDVSVASGFSTYTVSRALSSLPGVSEKTRAHVVATARDLGYVANQPARRLKQGASTTIGVLTANNANPFYSELVNGFEDVVIPAGYHCIVSDSTHHGEHSATRESRFLEDLLQQRVAGVALTYPPDDEQLRRLIEWPLPLVFMDSNAPAIYPDAPSVVVDSEEVSFEVGRHFAEHGYDDWMFLGHPRSWSTREDRQRGFTRAAKRFGAALEVVEGRNAPSDAANALISAIEARGHAPRAIFAANEPLVIGALQALRSLRLSVPDDVALIGYDETEWAQFANPALTLVDQSIARIGEIAGMQMLEQVGGHDNTLIPAVPTARLIVRDSCGTH